MIRYAKETVKEMLAGILLWGLFLSPFLLSFVKGPSKLPAVLGLWFGCVCAACMLLHMATTLETSIDTRDENAAKKKSYAGSLGRYLIFFAVTFLAYKSGWFHILTIFLGVFGLKAAAYLQPLVHKLLARLTFKKDRKE